MVNINYLNQFGSRIFRALAVIGVSVVLVAVSAVEVSAQSVGITDGTSITPNAKSLLDIRLDNSATLGKGLLIPRVTHAQRVEMTTAPNSLNNAASSATESGMLVYQYESGTSPKGFYHWNGTSWARLLDATSGGWSTIGNSGTVVGTNFLGTTDDVGLRLRTNNLERIRISGGDASTGGNVGIGLSGDAVERLQVNGNLVLSQGADRRLYVAQTTANVPGYDLTIEAGGAPNPSGNAQPGGHLVLQAGAGFANTNAGPGGNVIIRSGGNSVSGPTLATQWGDIVFEIGNNGASAAVEQMRISKLGKVTINDLIPTNPSTVSVVTANSTGELVKMQAGTAQANQVLKMNSAGTAIEWGAVAPATALSISGQAVGDMLYFDGTSWVRLPVPGASAGSAGVYWALTMPNAGTGTPSWAATTAFTTTGDDMGTHNATTRVNLNGNRITNDPTPTGNEGIGLDANGNVAIGVAVDAAYALKIAGKMNSNGINETSDFRFKKNIQDIPNALETVSKMRGVTYDWRTDEFPERNFSEGRDMGVIAQEMELLVPEVVSTGADGYKAVEYGHLVGILIEAIKEQQVVIEGQRDELTSLKGMKDELNSLKASVELLTEHIRTSQK